MTHPAAIKLKATRAHDRLSVFSLFVDGKEARLLPGPPPPFFRATEIPPEALFVIGNDKSLPIQICRRFLYRFTWEFLHALVVISAAVARVPPFGGLYFNIPA